MVTSRTGWGLGLLLAASCGGATVALDPPSRGAGEATGAPLLPPDTVEPGGTGPAYPGTGFRVHEWGTNTVVVGSDGSMQRGLHHEEEDLPSFVYDRRQPALQRTPIDVKMETPVTYFYSDRPLTAHVAVRFPKGILTQWYPAVRDFAPPTIVGYGDPALDRNFPFTDAVCREEFSVVREGRLDWGDVEVLPRGDRRAFVDAPLERFTWSHARDVDANAVRVLTNDGAEQAERFLFYRGLGSFPLGVRIAAQAGAAGRDGGLVLTNLDRRHAAGAVFVLRVAKDRASFEVRPAGIAAGASIEVTAPPATDALDTYVQALAKAMVAELDRAGLYHDESISMVKTWARQWFRTPGVRVLYLAPQAWTDEQIPLAIEPRPSEQVRVMVIRAEVITPAEEERDLTALASLGSGSHAAGDGHFRALGRFAEPRLRRAIARAPAPPAAAFELLDRIAGADVSVRSGE
jgi:hypothetical protein